ncbi:MAG: hypothetical protein D6737_16860 [Chloroflexi bacterium]|nr:MAG: hypothetical protein CUN54_04400 [Phototrophicales bacterium]RMF77731.1 MAG: hypothetical protein D6737_16860 [Chloroflexota bacterium]
MIQHFKRRAYLPKIWFFVFITFILSVIMLSNANVVSAQAGTISNVSISNVTCESMDVTYTVSGAVAPVGVLVEALSGGSTIGNQDGPDTNGTHTVTVTYFSPQPSGTNVRGMASNGSSSAQSGSQSCDGGGGGNGGGRNNGGGNGDGQPESAPPWSGFSDGRISPDPAEYYSIWCQADTIQVWRSVPETSLLKEISLADVLALSVGGEMALGDFMVIQRSSENIATIFGSNGNLAPEAGSKAFSLDDCVTANGGAPQPPSDDGQGDGAGGSNPPPTSEETDAQRAQREAQEALDFCFDSYGFFGDDAELLADCLNFVLSTEADNLSGEDIMTLIIMIFCLNIIVGAGVVPIGLIWLHRRRNPAAQIEHMIELKRSKE